MYHPKREEIAEGWKITFEPTHIMKDLVDFLFLILRYHIRYNIFLVIKLRKLCWERLKSLRVKEERHPSGWRLSNKKRSNVNTRSGFVRNHEKDFEHKQFRS